MGERTLSSLLTALSEIKGIEWIRLHYLYPDEVDDALIDVIAKKRQNSEIHRYPHPAHKRCDFEENEPPRHRGPKIRALFQKLRETIPGVVLRISIIAGLPGEGGTRI